MKKIAKGYIFPQNFPPHVGLTDILVDPSEKLNEFYENLFKLKSGLRNLETKYQKKHKSPERRNVAPQFP